MVKFDARYTLPHNLLMHSINQCTWVSCNVTSYALCVRDYGRRWLRYPTFESFMLCPVIYDYDTQETFTSSFFGNYYCSHRPFHIRNTHTTHKDFNRIINAQVFQSCFQYRQVAMPINFNGHHKALENIFRPMTWIIHFRENPLHSFPMWFM